MIIQTNYMHLQIRQYINSGPKFLISIWLGFFAIYALGLLIGYLFMGSSIISNLKLERFRSLIEILIYLLFLNPVIILLSLYLITKYIKNSNPYVLSALVGLLAAIILEGIEFAILNKYTPYSFYSLIRYLISISGLIFTWIIVLQTEKNIAKALSTGFFVFMLLHVTIGLIQKYIPNSSFEFLPVFISIIGSILGCAIFSKLFEQIVKLSMWSLKVKLS